MCVWLVGRGEGGRQKFLLKNLRFLLSVNMSLIGSVNSFFYVVLGTSFTVYAFQVSTFLQSSVYVQHEVLYSEMWC